MLTPGEAGGQPGQGQIWALRTDGHHPCRAVLGQERGPGVLGPDEVSAHGTRQNPQLFFLQSQPTTHRVRPAPWGRQVPRGGILLSGDSRSGHKKGSQQAPTQVRHVCQQEGKHTECSETLLPTVAYVNPTPFLQQLSKRPLDGGRGHLLLIEPARTREPQQTHPAASKGADMETKPGEAATETQRLRLRAGPGSSVARSVPRPPLSR